MKKIVALLSLFLALCLALTACTDSGIVSGTQTDPADQTAEAQPDASEQTFPFDGEDVAFTPPEGEFDPSKIDELEVSSGMDGDAAEDPDGEPVPVKAYIIVNGFEWGPGVNKVMLELDEPIDGIRKEAGMYVKTSYWDREVIDAYPSNRMGYAVEGPSKFVTLELVTNFDYSGAPFDYDSKTRHNLWAKSYVVGINVTVELNGEDFEIRFQEDCINNYFSPDVVAFTRDATYSGEYYNFMTQQTDTLSLNYALYEPESLAGGEQNPLIIWLHGRGEGGDNIEVTLLAYEVSAMTEKDIQSHFVSGDQVGAYIMVPQTSTYWRDCGDGREHEGDMPSRYQNILMDLITDYLEENPDVDPTRIYIMGASNGGFMALEMIENYPGYFAAAIAISPATAYNTYAREDDGSYREVGGQFVKTGDKYLTQDRVDAMKQTPIWIIGAATDNITPVQEYSAPLYYELIQGGAENCWCTMYINVIGTESTNTQYLGHWAWIYVFNDQVEYVQNPETVANATPGIYLYGLIPNNDGGTMQPPDGEGGVYANLFDWLNAQMRDPNYEPTATDSSLVPASSEGEVSDASSLGEEAAE